MIQAGVCLDPTWEIVVHVPANASNIVVVVKYALLRILGYVNGNLYTYVLSLVYFFGREGVDRLSGKELPDDWRPLTQEQWRMRGFHYG